MDQSVTAAAETSWLEWAAHNLATGVPVADIADEMIRAGIAATDARRLIETVEKHPIQRAANRLAADLRKWTDLSDVLLELESQCHDFRIVPRVRNLSSEAFHRDYYSLNRPVIIEDAAHAWPAFRTWSLQSLKERYGDHVVRYQKGRNPRNHRDAFINHAAEIRFGDYIDLVASGGPTDQYYLIAHDRMLERPEFRSLLADIALDERYFDPEDAAGRVFFWLGPAGSVTPIHRDLGNVSLVQVIGRKSIKLIPSRQIHKVYNEAGYHSEVDFEHIDFDRFPLVREAYVSEVVIEPGETLFIPVGWWHHVKALDISVTVTSNNFKFPNRFTEIF